MGVHYVRSDLERATARDRGSVRAVRRCALAMNSLPTAAQRDDQRRAMWQEIGRRQDRRTARQVAIAASVLIVGALAWFAGALLGMESF